jgi:carboxybiotin decarboxylase
MMKKLIFVLGILFVFTVAWSVYAKAQPATAGVANETSYSATTQQNASLTQGHQGTGFDKIWYATGFYNITFKEIVMILLALIVIFFAVKFDLERQLIIPIAIGVLIGNIPVFQCAHIQLGVYDKGSVLNFLYSGIMNGFFPALLFLSIGSRVDFSALIANPKLLLIGAAAQIGVFFAIYLALQVGLDEAEAIVIGIVGGLDSPTSIYTATKLTSGFPTFPGQSFTNFVAPAAMATFLFMALVPMIQKPIVRFMTSKNEKLMRMKPLRSVSKTEKLIFPIICLLISALIAPAALPILGMFFFGNILRESGVAAQLADRARTSMFDIVVILMGVTIGAAAEGEIFLTQKVVWLFVFGFVSLVVATIGGVLMAKIMNIFLKKENKINPLIGAAGVSVIPESANVAHNEAIRLDSTNHLQQHAMGPSVAGIIATAIAAGVLISYVL